MKTKQLTTTAACTEAVIRPEYALLAEAGRGEGHAARSSSSGVVQREDARGVVRTATDTKATRLSAFDGGEIE